MRKKYRYILIFIVIAVAAGILMWWYTFRPSKSSVASKKANVEIDAGMLLQAFETDENAANTMYLGKIISVTGVVESVSEDSVGISVYLKDTEAISGVICSFDKLANEITSVEKGATVTVKGICTGYLMDVVLNKCALEITGTD